MKRRFHKYLFFTFIFFLTSYPRIALCAPSNLTHALLPEEICQNLKTYIARLKPFLTGNIPEETYNRLIRFVSKIPVSTEMTGRGIQLDKLLPSLLPGLTKNVAFKGTADFTLAIKRPRPGMITLRVKISLKNPGIDTLSFQAKNTNILSQLTIYPSSHTVKGFVTCDVTSLSLNTTDPFKSRIGVSKINLQGSIKNQKYALASRIEKVRCTKIRWRGNSLPDISIQHLSLQPDKLIIKSLKVHNQPQLVILDTSHFNLASMQLTIRGKFLFNTPQPLFGKTSPIKKIRGPVSFEVTVDFHARKPIIKSTVKGSKINILTHRKPFVINDFRTQINLKGQHLTIPSLQFFLNHAMTCKASLSTGSLSRPLSNLKGSLSFSVDNVEKLRPVIESLFPGFPTPEKTSGTLAVKAYAQANRENLSVRGIATFYGDIVNSPQPMSLSGIALSLPFDLRVPFKSKSIKKSAHIDLPAQKEKLGTLNIHTIKFGLITLHRLSCHLQALGNKLTANEIRCNLFRGNASGKVFIDLLTPYPWHTKLKINRISLHEICENIPNIKDALSGRVNAYLTLSGKGDKLEAMQGEFKAEAIKTIEEPMHISQVFIRKLTGKKGSIFFYRKYRPYNKGIIKARIHRGIITFNTLELSHKILGFKDLFISVSRSSNKISIKDLIWEILQVPNTGTANPVIKTKYRSSQ